MTEDDLLSIREFVDHRANDLRLLSLDLGCKPIRRCDDPTVPEIIVAVDWSEIYALITAESPKNTDVVSRGVKSVYHVLSKGEEEAEDIVRGMHQVALSVLFDRLAGNLVLIPPYVSEMVNFVKVRRAAVFADLFADKMFDPRARAADRLRNHSKAISELLDYLATIKDYSRSEKLAAFKRWIGDNSRNTKLVHWVESEFGSMFMLSRLAQEDMLRRLTDLMSGGLNQQPPLRTLASYFTSRSFQEVKSANLSSAFWRAKLISLKGSNHRPNAVRHDSEALAYLEVLNLICHREGKQLLFATRSSDVLRVMAAYPGRFGCLSDHYRNGPERKFCPPPTIGRTWRSFFELGVALHPSAPPILSSKSVQQLSVYDTSEESEKAAETQTIQNFPDTAGEYAAKELVSMEAASALLRNTTRPTDEGVRITHELWADLERKSLNLQTFVSIVSPYFPKKLSRPEAPWEQAASFFVEFASNPEHLAAERKRWQEILLTSLKQVERAILIAQDEIFDEGGRDSRSFTKMVVGSLELHLFAKELSNPSFAEPYLRALNSLTDPNGLEGLSDYFQPSKDGDSEIDSKNSEYLMFLLCAGFAAGALEQVRYLIVRFHREFEQLVPTGLSWALYRLIDADYRHLLYSATDIAYQRLRAACDQVGRLSRARGAACLGHAALLLARITLHLDMIEEFDERLDAFPVYLLDGKLELEHIFFEVKLMLYHLTGLQDATLLRRNLATLFIYAGARLAPVQETFGVPFWSSGSNPVYMKQQYFEDATVRAELIDLHARQDKSIEEQIVLSYYHLKAAYWGGMHDSNYQFHILSCESLLRAAENRTRKSRFREMISRQLKLLNKIVELHRSKQ